MFTKRLCPKKGMCLMALGDLSGARERARKAVQLGKQESSYTLLIKILISEGDLKGAAAVCSSSIE